MSDTQNEMDVILADSVNYLDDSARGKVVVASSHGGIYAAYKAAQNGARGVILNDAGIGLEEAGIASLKYCEEIGVAAAVVSHDSARIGDVADMIRRGVISHSNDIAQKVQCVAGMRCSDGAEALKGAPGPTSQPTPYEESRFIITEEFPKVICIDSASLVKDEDAGQILITGSHGGLIGGRPEKAFNVPAMVAVFNDAGSGIDDAGIGRLVPLDKQGIAGVTIAHTSARIGDSRSTYYSGIISHFNSKAAELGASIGQLVRDFVDLVRKNTAS